jgi:hypothetical protein
MFYKYGRRSLSHNHLLEFMFWSMNIAKVYVVVGITSKTSSFKDVFHFNTMP